MFIIGETPSALRPPMLFDATLPKIGKVYLSADPIDQDRRACRLITETCNTGSNCPLSCKFCCSRRGHGCKLGAKVLKAVFRLDQHPLDPHCLAQLARSKAWSCNRRAAVTTRSCTCSNDLQGSMRAMKPFIGRGPFLRRHPAPPIYGKELLAQPRSELL